MIYSFTIFILFALRGGDAALPAGTSYARRLGESSIDFVKLSSDVSSIAKPHFGHSVVSSGNTIIVGAYLDSCDYSGSAYIFEKSGSAWTQTAKLVAPDSAMGDFFGYSISMYSSTVVVGAYLDDAVSSDSGSAYVFEKSDSCMWTQTAKLVAADTESYDYFGTSVSTSGDTVVVGAYLENDGAYDSGSAYIFEQSESEWTQVAKLVAPGAAASDYFGLSVSIFNGTIVVGAYNDDDGGYNAGSAYVFKKSGSAWIQTAKLTASDSAPYSYFGNSVSTSGDTIVVGAYNSDDDGPGSGSAYVFALSGDHWIQKAKLVAPDAGAYDYFGTSVSTSGGTIVIGADGSDEFSNYILSGGDDEDTYPLNHGGDQSGSAYLFEVTLAPPIPTPTPTPAPTAPALVPTPAPTRACRFFSFFATLKCTLEKNEKHWGLRGTALSTTQPTTESA